MARHQAHSSIKNNRRQPPKNQGKQPRPIRKQSAVRRSARLESLREQLTSTIHHTGEIQTSSSSPISNVLTDKTTSQHSSVLIPLEPSEKRKREQDVERCSLQTRNQPPSKRPRTSPASCIVEEKPDQEATSDISDNVPDPLLHWIQTGRWRKEYFEQDNQTREDFERGKSPVDSEENYWLREDYAQESFKSMPGMHPLAYLFARKKPSASSRRKNSQNTLTASDELPREIKSAQYRSPDYETRLERKGSYMREYNDVDDGEKMEELCNILLEKDQSFPQDTLFRDDLFKKTCEKIRIRNEAMVIRDIGQLICPSAQHLATYGAKHLNHLYETVNEGWNSVIPFEGTRPQPDYSVGFARSAFTQEQMDKLEPFVGAPGSQIKLLTYFMVTTRMYFPFLTCEVKCGAAALDVADRQNAHSMTVAVKGIFELYRAVKREKELDRQILAFSISHDHTSVRIYGHYLVIEKNKTTFYRYPIRDFNFAERGGKEKWATHQFVKNVYDSHSVKLHKMICSAIDKLPAGVNFDLSQSAFFSQSTPQDSQRSIAEPIEEETDSQLSSEVSQEVTPTTSYTQTTEPASKKQRSDKKRR